MSRRKATINSRNFFKKETKESTLYVKKLHRSKSLEDSQEWYARELEYQLNRGKLFEDPFMPATNATIGKDFSDSYQWRRPHELVESPKFFSDGISRFDVIQGNLGDCWLLAAACSLSMHPNLFYKVVPKHQTFDPPKRGQTHVPVEGVYPYCGMFWFRLWHFGEWVDIVVDDRLPCQNNELVFLHSTDKSEFWSALLEKAYAKLFGCFEDLRGGSTAEAMEDFTGGLTELVELGDKAPANLFNNMLRAQSRLSLMACSIDSTPEQRNTEGPCGLILGHAYSITDVRVLRTSSDRNDVKMIRMRNPWGNEKEWNGPWSDESDAWRCITPEERQRIGLTFDHDGEFWMEFCDFINYFSRLELCHLGPETEYKDPKSRIKCYWEMAKHEGEWLRNSTAGGCRNYVSTFHLNPQFHVCVESPDDVDGERMGTLIIGLMQRDMRQLRLEPFVIGYSIYKLPDNWKKGTLLDKNFFMNTKSADRSRHFINLREVCGRHKLAPGNYVIIPSTFAPNEEARFMLRIFSEKVCRTQELDDVTRISNTSTNSQLPAMMENKKLKRLEDAFYKISGPSKEITADELKDILNVAFKDDFPFDGFSKETVRSMVALLDADLSGTLGFEEFKKLWTELRIWKTIFKKFDSDHSGLLNAFELRQVMGSIGFHVSNQIYKAIACRYGDRSGQISFDDYVLLLVRLMTVFETFKAQRRTENGCAVFEADDFIQAVIYI